MNIENPPSGIRFPVVGIGASAGGYAALSTLLQNMPADSGMALVVILHLSADEPSAADKLLQRATAMPVVQVAHTMPVLPGKVYVIPPGRSLAMHNGELVLDRLERGGVPVAIDMFLRTLPDAHRENAIGIVLSGMGSDGTAGLAHIREMGGTTIVQQPADAEHGSMPRAAIEAGVADFVLPAAEMPRKLSELRDTLETIRRKAAADTPDAAPSLLGPRPEAALREVLAVLQARTGYDFTHYRRPTLLRRLERRLQVRGTLELDAYLGLLDEDGAEAQALLADLLIGVTGFYRDPEAFEALARVALPGLFSAGAEPPRVWVTACSTGEEVYTLAMMLAERAAGGDRPRAWQMFASDIDEHAVEAARAGVYPLSIEAAVPEAQLQRWFTREADHYKVRKSLRDSILFARHNLLHEPAFSRLDLISCRNFLIYLNPDMHRHLLQQFHFALNPGGYLMLGSAESADMAADLFVPVDAAQKIYQARRDERQRATPAVPAWTGSRTGAPWPGEAAAGGAGDTAARHGKLFSFADIHLHKAAELAPPSILLNAEGEILHISEQAAVFLRQAGGEPTRELASLVAPALQLALRAALFQAVTSGHAAGTGPIRCEQDGGVRTVDVQVLPFRDPHAEGGLVLVRFVAVAEPSEPSAQAAPAWPQDPALLGQLDEELRRTRRQLRDTIEQAEVGGDEMRLYIEEMQTTVEELRVSVAELEHSRGQVLFRNQNWKSATASCSARRTRAPRRTTTWPTWWRPATSPPSSSIATCASCATRRASPSSST